MVRKLQRHLIFIILLTYTFYLLKVILFKYIFSWTMLVEHTRMIKLDYLAREFRSSNFIPFFTIWDYLSGDSSSGIVINNILGNVVLFIPVGLLVGYLIRTSIIKVLIIGFVLSLAIEILQIVLLLGTFDVDDLLLNSIGSILGALLIKGIIVTRNKIVKSTR
jgi:glycopeptide antibiotics resistance protein